MKFVAWIFAALVAVPISTLAQTNVVNGLVAIVNDKVITWKDVDRAILPELATLRATYGRNPALYMEKAEALRRQRIDELVEKETVENSLGK